MDFRPAFEQALPYGPFLEKFATPDQRERWMRLYDAVPLSEDQCALLHGFRRKMPVICLAGPWCGDCVNACPIFQRIAEVTPQIDLRFINRSQRFDVNATDADTAIANELSICGAPRVPVLLFLSEDWYECERFGERTLATYRDKVAKMQGLSCPTGLGAVQQNILAANTAEWLTHFERVQLMLLTSPRLQKLHGEI